MGGGGARGSRYHFAAVEHSVGDKQPCKFSAQFWTAGPKSRGGANYEFGRRSDCVYGNSIASRHEDQRRFELSFENEGGREQSFGSYC